MPDAIWSIETWGRISAAVIAAAAIRRGSYSPIAITGHVASTTMGALVALREHCRFDASGFSDSTAMANITRLMTCYVEGIDTALRSHGIQLPEIDSTGSPNDSDTDPGASSAQDNAGGPAYDTWHMLDSQVDAIMHSCALLCSQPLSPKARLLMLRAAGCILYVSVLGGCLVHQRAVFSLNHQGSQWTTWIPYFGSYAPAGDVDTTGTDETLRGVPVWTSDTRHPLLSAAFDAPHGAGLGALLYSRLVQHEKDGNRYRGMSDCLEAWSPLGTRISLALMSAATSVQMVGSLDPMSACFITSLVVAVIGPAEHTDVWGPTRSSASSTKTDTAGKKWGRLLSPHLVVEQYPRIVGLIMARRTLPIVNKAGDYSTTGNNTCHNVPMNRSVLAAVSCLFMAASMQASSPGLNGWISRGRRILTSLEVIQRAITAPNGTPCRSPARDSATRISDGLTEATPIAVYAYDTLVQCRVIWVLVATIREGLTNTVAWVSGKFAHALMDSDKSAGGHRQKEAGSSKVVVTRCAAHEVACSVVLACLEILTDLCAHSKYVQSMSRPNQHNPSPGRVRSNSHERGTGCGRSPEPRSQSRSRDTNASRESTIGVPAWSVEKIVTDAIHGVGDAGFRSTPAANPTAPCPECAVRSQFTAAGLVPVLVEWLGRVSTGRVSGCESRGPRKQSMRLVQSTCMKLLVQVAAQCPDVPSGKHACCERQRPLACTQSQIATLYPLLPLQVMQYWFCPDKITRVAVAHTTTILVEKWSGLNNQSDKLETHVQNIIGIIQQDARTTHRLLDRIANANAVPVRAHRMTRAIAQLRRVSDLFALCTRILSRLTATCLHFQQTSKWREVWPLMEYWVCWNQPTLPRGLVDSSHDVHQTWNDVVMSATRFVRLAAQRDFHLQQMPHAHTPDSHVSHGKGGIQRAWNITEYAVIPRTVTFLLSQMGHAQQTRSDPEMVEYERLLELVRLMHGISVRYTASVAEYWVRGEVDPQAYVGSVQPWVDVFRSVIALARDASAHGRWGQPTLNCMARWALTGIGCLIQPVPVNESTARMDTSGLEIAATSQLSRRSWWDQLTPWSNFKAYVLSTREVRSQVNFVLGNSGDDFPQAEDSQCASSVNALASLSVRAGLNNQDPQRETHDGPNEADPVPSSAPLAVSGEFPKSAAHVRDTNVRLAQREDVCALLAFVRSATLACPKSEVVVAKLFPSLVTDMELQVLAVVSVTPADEGAQSLSPLRSSNYTGTGNTRLGPVPGALTGCHKCTRPCSHVCVYVSFLRLWEHWLRPRNNVPPGTRVEWLLRCTDMWQIINNIPVSVHWPMLHTTHGSIHDGLVQNPALPYDLARDVCDVDGINRLFMRVCELVSTTTV